MTIGLGRRARTAEELEGLLASLADFPLVNFRPLEPRSGDVFITSWAKSGTTMMQQMFHQLRMIIATGDGDMDFDDISRMTPWEDSAVITDSDMNEMQRAGPRGFKSHREYERLPPGCRYVVTLRDPHETYVSFHRFMEGWMLEPGMVSLEQFFPMWMGGGPGGCDYFTHLLSWYARRNEVDSLVTTYRDAVKNKRETIARMAKLVELEVDNNVIDKVEHMTSREFMYAHKDRFDDAMNVEAFELKLGIPPNSDSTKVQAKGSDARKVPEEVSQQIDAMWAERVTPMTGHANFAELAAEFDN